MCVITANLFVSISASGNGNECATRLRSTGKAGVLQSFSRTQGIIVIASKIMAAEFREISVRYGHAQTGNGMKTQPEPVSGPEEKQNSVCPPGKTCEDRQEGRLPSSQFCFYWAQR